MDILQEDRYCFKVSNEIIKLFRKPFQNVNRWFTTLVNQPNMKAVLGEVALAAKMAEFDSKKFAEFSGK